MTKDEILEGQLVQVQARTWPGINKPGGVGRVVRRGEQDVDVQYVLGGGEKGVPLQYVTIIEVLTPQNCLRDRSVLLGRCKNCGSLRTDCGSCDLEKLQIPIRLTNRLRTAATNKKNHASSDECSNFPESEVSVGHCLNNQDQVLPFHDSSDDDSDSAIDDHFIAAFKNNRRLRRNISFLSRLERHSRPKSDRCNREISRIEGLEDDADESEHDSSIHCCGDTNSINSHDKRSDSSNCVSSSTQTPNESPSQLMYPQILRIPHCDGELLVDNDLDGFIQPEGAAINAPRDNEDRTVHIAFEHLPLFFEETLNRVNAAMPLVRVKLLDISRRVDMRKGAGAPISDLEEEGWQLYDSTIDDLLLGGLDQCRFAFRRLNSRKEFRNHEANLSSRQKKKFGAPARTMRDVLFDQADKDVEDLLRELRHFLLNQLKMSPEDRIFGDVDSEDSQLSNKSRQSFSEDEHPLVNRVSFTAPNFEPHMHARRKKSDGKSANARLNIKDRRARAQRKQVTQANVVPNVAEEIVNDALNRASVIDVTLSGIANNIESKGQSTISFSGHSAPKKASKKRRLGTSTCKKSEISDPKRRRRLRNHQREQGIDASTAVVDRMQSFLDVNRDLSDNDSGFAMQHCQQSFSTKNLEHSIENSDQDIFSNFFDMDFTGDSEHHIIGIADSIAALRSCCRNKRAVDELQKQISDSVASSTRETTLSIFSEVHSYLKGNPHSLQELISKNHTKLKRHLQFLEAVLMLLQQGLQVHLQENDGILFSLFAGNQPCLFVQMIILQFLDVLYGIFHPKAWATKGDFNQSILLRSFFSLRNGLSCLIPLTEISCNYLLHRFGCQFWWKCRDGGRFVSSLDPEMCRLFLKTAVIASPVCVRLRQFDSMLPRVEVQTVWSIIGFMSASNFQVPTSSSKYRWRLVYTILCCDTGVLPKAVEDCERSKASPSHIAQCDVELGHLNQLIDKGSMMPLDGTDKIVETIIRRAVLLQAKFSNQNDVLHQSHRKLFTRESVVHLWNASSPNYQSSPNEDDLYFLGRNFLMPGLLQKVVNLLGHWIRQTKAKPVLLAQLEQTISKMQSLGHSHFASGHDRGTFVGCFEDKGIDSAGFVRGAVGAVLSTFEILRLENALATKRENVSVAAMSRIWARISDPTMERQHQKLMGKGTLQQSSHRSASHYFIFIAAIRTFCAYLLIHLGEPLLLIEGHKSFTGLTKTSDESSDVNRTFLVHEAISYVVASLDCLCTCILSSNLRDSISESYIEALSLSFIWISQLCNVCREALQQERANTSGRQWSELKLAGCDILNLCGETLRNCLFAVLSLAKHDKADTCFHLCLTLIRSVIGWAAVGRAIDPLSRANDEFDDLDDSMLLGIDSLTPEETAAKKLSTTIMTLLELADPAKIYSVRSNISFENKDVRIDSQARMMLSRFSGALCACLACLVADGSKISLKSSVVIGNQRQSCGNKFCEYVAFSLLAETCELAGNFPRCKDFLEQESQTLLMTIMQMILDADSLERFPTCDLQRMLTVTGDKGARREQRKLSFSSGMSNSQESTGSRSPVCNFELGAAYVCRNLWRCLRNLQNIIDLRLSTGLLGRLLDGRDLENETDETFSFQTNSLEKECIRRMNFLLRLFKVDVSMQSLPPFEDALRWAITYAIVNLLKISDGLKYHDLKRCSSKIDMQCQLKHSHGKLLVLQTCYAEMFVELVVSVVLTNWFNLSDSFRRLLSNIREILIFSMNPPIDNDIEGFFRGFLGQIERHENVNYLRDVPLLDLRRSVKRACFRRCGEIIRSHLSHAPTSDQHRGVIAFVASSSCFANESSSSGEFILDVVAEGFRTRDVSTSSRPDGMHFSEELIDENRCTSKDDAVSSGESHVSFVSDLRMFVLAEVMPSMLNNRSHVSEHTKAAIVDLANRLLYIEADEARALTGMRPDRALMLYELLNALWDEFCESIQRGPDSSILLSSILRCISLVMALPTNSVNQRAQSLLCWSRAHVKATSDSDMTTDRTRLELLASYVSTFAKLALHIARFLNDPDTTPDIMVSLVPQRDAETVLGHRMAEQLRDPSSVESLIARMRNLKDAIRNDSKDKRALHRNMYIKKSSTKGCQAFLLGINKLSPEVKREATNLIAIMDGCFEIR